MEFCNKDSWVKHVWETNFPLYEKTKNLNFINGLIHGNLDQNEFQRYLEQDYLYLQAFTQLLEKIRGKIDIPKYHGYFSDFITENMEQETTMQRKYLKDTNLDRINKLPITNSFIEFLQELHDVNLPCALAGILPCFVIYQQLGIYIYNEHIKDMNPFVDWIHTYEGVEHAESVRKIIEVCTYYSEYKDPEILKQMDIYYSKACLLDHYFWTGTPLPS